MSNHPEPMLKNSTHFAISEMMWFEKVRGGSMHLIILLFIPQQLRPGTYVKKLGLKRVATCYTCKRKVTSQRGFENHVDSQGHLPVPEEYAATASTADEVVVGSKGKTKFLLL